MDDDDDDDDDRAKTKQKHARRGTDLCNRFGSKMTCFWSVWGKAQQALASKLDFQGSGRMGGGSGKPHRNPIGIP